MPVTTRFDARNLHRKLQKMTNNLPAARNALVMDQGRLFMDEVLWLSEDHRDTHRNIRGWQLAANAAGVGPRSIDALQQAKWYEQYVRSIAKQYHFWLWVVKGYEKAGREKEKYLKMARRKLKTAEEALNRIKSKGAESAIVVDLFAKAGGRLTTVRLNLPTHGGTGYVRTIGNRTVIIFHNREPHASLVEHRFKIVAQAHSYLRQKTRGTGAKQASLRWLREVTRGTDFQVAG